MRRAPKGYVLTIFGIIGALGIGLGVGGFVTFLGLGIIDSLNHRGCLNCVSIRCSIEFYVCLQLNVL